MHRRCFEKIHTKLLAVNTPGGWDWVWGLEPDKVLKLFTQNACVLLDYYYFFFYSELFFIYCSCMISFDAHESLLGKAGQNLLS